MGSDSDLPTMAECARVLEDYKVPYDIASLRHRSPEEAASYAREAVDRGLRVIIAGAGGPPTWRARWPRTPRCPSSGCPWTARRWAGRRAPGHGADAAGRAGGGGGRGLDGRKNAGHLAVAILALQDDALRARLQQRRKKMADEIVGKAAALPTACARSSRARTTAERRARIALAAIALLSLALDLAGITWGLPARWQRTRSRTRWRAWPARARWRRTRSSTPRCPCTRSGPCCGPRRGAADAGWLQGVAADPLVVGRALSRSRARWPSTSWDWRGCGSSAGLGLLAAALLAIAPGVVNLLPLRHPEPWLLLGRRPRCCAARPSGRPAQRRPSRPRAGPDAGTKYTAAALVVPCSSRLAEAFARSTRPVEAFATRGRWL